MRTSGWIAAAIVLAGCGTAEPVKNDSAATRPDIPDITVNQPAAKPITTAAPAAPKQEAAAGSPCNVQDGKPVTRKLKALGTEPFWAAEVDGRCVTYKTPEYQQGQRIWTKVTPDGNAWDGAYDNQRFKMGVKSSPGCSDGMSDKTYPMEAELLVNGETRRGCAEPL